jgi:putative FmdB family regulatory protein
MPTYEYECAKCKKTFEAFQSMKDKAYATCPKEKCRMRVWGKGRVKRLLGGGAGFLFKGSGFYITDYRSEGYKSAAKTDSPGTGSSGGEKKGGTDGSKGSSSQGADPGKVKKPSSKKE